MVHLVQTCTEGHCLSRLGGMITLTELYYVYNRARGLDLISPHDLLKATEKLDGLDDGIKMKVLAPSSLTVVQLTSVDEKHI